MGYFTELYHMTNQLGGKVFNSWISAPRVSFINTCTERVLNLGVRTSSTHIGV